MKFFLISDNIDTCMGMRLTGIEGVVVHEITEVQQELKTAFANPEIGIILMTQKVINLCPDVVYKYKLTHKSPLIVEIPDRHATSTISDSISNYIQEAIGIVL